VFGHYFTDHMFYAEWTEKDGWVKSGIRPLENISLAPSATVFHYGVSVCSFGG
jgi:branched-chain amino acid aminotransferase